MDSALPYLKCTVKLPSLKCSEKSGAKIKTTEKYLKVYDVEFYPYTIPGVDAVFAICAGARVIVARCVLGIDHAIEVIASFEDEQMAKVEYDIDGYNSLTWSQAVNGDPLLCVSGIERQVRIFNVITKELVANLMAHGGGINDLATSPIDPTILVTCSSDHSIRIWSLKEAHRKQPVAAILFGPDHKDQVLTIAYHRKGRFILSGDVDTKVAVWAVPEDLEEQHMGTDNPKLIQRPHFSTNEIHTDFVDCVQWYNDLIISHASREDKLILWKIDNFSSDRADNLEAPVPPSTAIRSDTPVTKLATSGANTRSAWGGKFQRLLEFQLPDNQQWYTRFSIFHGLHQTPILVAGNEKSKAFFWDLHRLESAGTEPPMSAPAVPNYVREDSASSNASSDITTGSNRSKGTRKQSKVVDMTQAISNPFRPVKPHNIITIPKYKDFKFRHFAWSCDGQWCIGVGDAGAIIVFHRDNA